MDHFAAHGQRWALFALYLLIMNITLISTVATTANAKAVAATADAAAVATTSPRRRMRRSLHMQRLHATGAPSFTWHAARGVVQSGTRA